MELAVLLAAGLRDWIDFGVIIGILLLNATVGWYQEKQAADVVASLKGDIAMKAEVVRDGTIQEIKARELVPGDIVRTISRFLDAFYSSWHTELTYSSSSWKKARSSLANAV
jgi:magnesium-transporting ATPase (P-type)